MSIDYQIEHHLAAGVMTNMPVIEAHAEPVRRHIVWDIFNI